MARIHIADGDSTIRQMVTYLMVDQGHEVSVSKDGEEVLRHVMVDPPDCLLLDIMIPVMDGYGVLASLETSGLRDRTRILVLTAKVTEQERETILDLGADYCMAKPFEPDELIATVDELLALSEEEVVSRRQRDKDTAHLLSQLESLFDGN